MLASLLFDSVRLIRSRQEFRHLLIARLFSAFGTYMVVVALTVDILERTGSSTWVGLVLMAEFLPSLALAFVIGPLVDRWSRKRMMIGSDLANAILFSLIALAVAPWQILVLVIGVGIASGLFVPSVYAGLPNLVEEQDLPRANSLLQTTSSLSLMLGPALGGLIVVAGGPDGAYLINALSYLISAIYISRIKAESLQGERAPSQGHWRDFRAGLTLVRRSPHLRTVLVAWSLCITGFTVLEVSAVVMAKEVLGVGDQAYGFMLAVEGAGLLLGGLLAAPLIEWRGVRLLYPTAIAFSGLALFSGSFSSNLHLTMLFLAAFGIGNGAALVGNALLIQRGAPDQMRGRVMTVLMGVGSTAMVFGYLGSGLFTDAFGARASWMLAASVLALAALVAVRLLPAGSLEIGEENEDGNSLPSQPVASLDAL